MFQQPTGIYPGSVYVESSPLQTSVFDASILPQQTYTLQSTPTHSEPHLYQQTVLGHGSTLLGPPVVEAPIVGQPVGHQTVYSQGIPLVQSPYQQVPLVLPQQQVGHQFVSPQLSSQIYGQSVANNQIYTLEPSPYTPYQPTVLLDENEESQPKIINVRRMNSNVQSGIQQFGQGNMNMQGNIQQAAQRSTSLSADAPALRRNALTPSQSFSANQVKNLVQEINTRRQEVENLKQRLENELLDLNNSKKEN